MTTGFANTNALHAAVAARTLANLGARSVVISPGSRSTPLTHAFVGTPGMDCTPVLDERTAGFFALGPVERGWAGSLTPYLTNTLAIRLLTVHGDSVRMIVASREGDVRFQGRLTDDGRTMEGIVEYHGGALVPMTATRRTQPVVPR